MGLTERMQSRTPMLMVAALGERLKSEYHLVPDEQVALSGILYQSGGREALKSLWQEYIDTASAHHLPILLTTPTRRVNRERAEHFAHRDTVIADHVALLRELQQEASGEVYIGGLMGCRGDAYTGKGCLSTEEALEFHRWQAEQFRNSPVDFLMAGIQANTVADSYGNLERGVNLKPTGPKGLAREMMRLRKRYGLSLFGGCCGTDGRYLEAMAQGLDGRL